MGMFDHLVPTEPMPDAAPIPPDVKRVPVGYVEKALEPITSYPSTYSQMNKEAQEQTARGVEQLSNLPKKSFTSREDPNSYVPEGYTEAAKGIGNTLAGAAGYVASPLSAAIRTVVGKPVEENTGIPKEYTEFATSLALPGVGLTKLGTPPIPPPTLAGNVAAASSRLGVPIPKAAITESLPVQQMAGALKEVPVIGSPLVKASRNALEGLDDAARNTAAKYGSTEALTAGEAATEGIKGWITKKSSDVASNLYDKVDNLVDQNFARPLHETQQVIADIMAKRANARISGQSRAVSEVKDAAFDPVGLNYHGVKDLRTYLRDMTPEEMVAKGVSPAEAKRLYSAVTQDMRATVLDAGGPDALSAFDKANHVYNLISERRAALSKIIGLKGDATPERVLENILTKASSKGGADYNTLVQARKAMGPQNWDEVTSAAVNRMGRVSPEAGFSGDRFVTAWNNLSEKGKKVLFDSTGKSDLAQSVEDIATLSQAHKQLARFGNPSGTGRVGSMVAAVGAAFAAPLTTLTTALGGYTVARMLSSPVVAKAAANWSKSYVAAQAAKQSYGAMRRLAIASDGLAIALKRDLGVDASKALHAFQGPSSINADEEKPQRAEGGPVAPMTPMPESPATLIAQQTQLIAGDRGAQLFPGGIGELPVPANMKRVKTPNGDVWHFNPKKVKASDLFLAAKNGTENEILDLGPGTKHEALSRAQAGERPVAVVERNPAGTEVRGSAATIGNLSEQLAAVRDAASDGHSVGVEEPEEVLQRRQFASGGAAFGTLSPAEQAEDDSAPGVVGPFLANAAKHFVAAPGQLMKPNPYPEGSEEASWYEDQRTKLGEQWSREAALNTMGTGAIAGAPVKGAEALLGAGPVRRIADDTGAKATKAIRSTELPSIREMPRDEAIAVARKEPHLIKAGDQSEGFYVGGPRDINSKKALAKLRKEFDDYVAADPRGGDWYDRYRASVNEVTGGDRAATEWMRHQHGQWSAGVSPEGELAFALKENNASLAGMPVKSARPAQHEAHEAAIAAQDPSKYQLGPKTSEYARLINPVQERPPGATGVNDFRHARNFKYTQAGGDAQAEALTAGQHRFLDYETALAVDRANKAKLAGRDDWTGEQLQAAPWVRQKALDIQSRNPNLTYDEAFARANTTIGDFFDKHVAHATHEAMPGAETGHMPLSVGASAEERAAFSADPRSTWANAPGERDAIYGGMSIPGTGVAARVRPTTEMQGLYTTPGGVTEANPGWNARPLVAFDAGKSKTVAPADQAMLNAGEATRGYIDAQQAAAWHKHWLNGAPGESNSLFIPREGKATPEQLMELQKLTAPHGLGDVADTGRGITATNFWPPPEKDIGAALRANKGQLEADIRQVTGGTPYRTKMDSNLIDYSDAWKAGEGSGAATKQLLEHVNQTPQLRTALNENPHIPKNAVNRLYRDKDWAEKWGAPRKDIQNARRIIGEGPGWIDRLEAAVKSGALLPAAAIAILGTAAAQHADEQ